MEEVDYEQLVIPDEKSLSDQNRKLKRLKRASEASKRPLLGSVLQDDELKSPEGSSKSLDSTKSGDELPESEHRSAEFQREKESEEFDELFPWEGERSGAKRALDFDDDGGNSNDEFDIDRDSENQPTDEFDIDRDSEKRGLGRVVEDTKGKKKRVKNNGVDGDKNERKSKKKKKDKSAASGNPKVLKRMENQERKAEVAMLVDYQRQLRERRDVAFKPLSFVQKPVSSVLERIRQRKQQISIKTAISISSQLSDPLREITLDSDGEELEEVVIVTKEDCRRESLCKGEVDSTAMKDGHLNSSPPDGSGEEFIQLSNGHNSCQTPLVEDKKPSTAFCQPTNDTQELFSESQACDMQDDHSNVETGRSQDVDLAPTLPSMNLKLESAHFDDTSSEDEEEEEEENDKENINPLTGQLFTDNLSPRGDPVREFVDEEALEEDCSDDEIRRFDDDGEDVSDAEELAELIATNYNEKPVDGERRNELHQMWLAQQDEAGTENLLQRLKCKKKMNSLSLLDEEDDGENTHDEFDTEEDLHTDVSHLNTKKLKQMIPLMFTDKDDGYKSSDDEETERRLNKQRLLGEVEMKEHALFASVAETEMSSGVFGRIKKLNSVPGTRKKAKTSSFFQNLVVKGSDSSSSKSSFLNRMSSIPVTKKRASNIVKSFIFGRDDSNSRSSINASEEDSRDTMNQAEKSNQRKRTFTAKFSSQARQSTQSNIETSHSTSLLDILKRSSVQTSLTLDNDMADHQAVFAAFKPSKRPGKIEVRS